jgi:hypothetical protein
VVDAVIDASGAGVWNQAQQIVGTFVDTLGRVIGRTADGSLVIIQGAVPKQPGEADLPPPASQGLDVHTPADVGLLPPVGLVTPVGIRPKQLSVSVSVYDDNAFVITELGMIRRTEGISSGLGPLSPIRMGVSSIADPEIRAASFPQVRINGVDIEREEEWM